MKLIECIKNVYVRIAIGIVGGALRSYVGPIGALIGGIMGGIIGYGLNW